MQYSSSNNHSVNLREKVEILKRVGIFNTAEENILLEIVEVLTEFRVQEGITIFEQDDEGNAMYIIVEGKVRVFDPDNDYTFAELGAGKVFGEYALLDTEKRSASVSTIEDTFLLSLEQETFYKLMLSNQEILRGILQELVKRSRNSNQLQEDLAQKKEELSTTIEELHATLEALRISKELIEEKTLAIQDSIEYAQNIQKALLPHTTKFQELLPEHFIFFLPRDVVSGDFYWITEKHNKIIVAAVDCTGHGVPGAFMSLLGINFLNQIVELQGVTEADKILTKLNIYIQGVLNQEKTQNQDGMDMSLCVINKKEQKLDFAGAKNPLYYIENQELKRIKGSLFPIGGMFIEGLEKTYPKHTIPLEKDTIYYIFSDGFQDQFGGKDDKKYTVRSFKNILLEIHQKDMKSQKEALSTSFKHWKEFSTEQTDDVLVIGFKI